MSSPAGHAISGVRPRNRQCVRGSPVCSALLALVLLVGTASGCRPGSKKGPPGQAPAHGQHPTISVGPFVATPDRHERDNRLFLKVTCTNQTEQTMTVFWEQFRAKGDQPLLGPFFPQRQPRRTLDPGETVTTVVSFAVPIGHNRPESLTVTYPQEKPVFSQKLKVHPLPTSGFAFRLDLPAMAVLTAPPPPRRGRNLEVRLQAEIRNPTKEPRLFIPFWFEAVSDDQRVPHVGDDPACLDTVQILDPGERLRGMLLFRLSGVRPVPQKIHIRYPGGERPDFAEWVPVKQGAD